MIEEYPSENNFNKNNDHEKPKHRILYGLLILCCCLIITISAFSLFANGFPFTTDKQPDTNYSSGSVTNDDSNLGSPDGAPGLAPELPKIADTAQSNADEAAGPITNNEPNSGSSAAAPGMARELPKIADTAQSNADEAASNSGQQSNADEATWCLILVNKQNHVPDDYKVELTQLANGQSVDKRIYAALQKMFDTARSEGIYPSVVAGYRTVEKQQSLMDKKIAEFRNQGYSVQEAKTKAEGWVAIPGTSEHQLGIAVDVGADETLSTDKEVEEWLNQNAHKFGFIRRYPPDKTDITGINNEPWHYRYVGIKAATEIKNQDVCLEEYLNRMN